MSLKEVLEWFAPRIEKTLSDSAPVKCSATKQIWIRKTQISDKKTVNLRTAKETEENDVIHFRQFDPNSFGGKSSEIRCRVPDCSATTPRRKPMHAGARQGLFLCGVHRTKLTSLVVERCAKEGVIVNIADYENEDFDCFLSMIEVLEKAFQHHRNKSYSLSSNPTESILAEVFLNTRNFFIIGNALITSDNETAVPFIIPYLMLLQKFLTSLHDLETLHSLLLALQEVMSMVLSFFGIIYPWVFLENVGAQVGSYAGFALGIAGALACGSLTTGLLAACAVGVLAGGLIGGGSYDWYREHRYTAHLQKQMVESYEQFMSKQLMKPVAHGPPLYYAVVDLRGDLIKKT